MAIGVGLCKGPSFVIVACSARFDSFYVTSSIVHAVSFCDKKELHQSIRKIWLSYT